MERWTRWVLRHRFPVLGAWLVVLVLGTAAFLRLPALLANDFVVPGTDSERARTIQREHLGQRPDGNFQVVFRVSDARDPAVRARLDRVLARAAHAVPTGRAERVVPAGRTVLFGNVDSRLRLSQAKRYTDDLRRALGQPAGTRAYVTGAAAISHDLDPIFSRDLAKGESIALPIALAVLVAVFGLSVAVTLPFLFAGCTIMGTLGIVWLVAHEVQMATYVTNLVQLIGLGIAIDYSLLVVYRFREELEREGSDEDAIVRTMLTAGRAVLFSGATVAIGLALLLFIPLPFIRGMGFGGFLLPLLSMAAALTLQPALLSVYGRRGVRRAHVADALRRRGLPLPRFRGTADVEDGLWARLARSIMRRPLLYLAAGSTLLVAAAIPAFRLHLTPGEIYGTPTTPSSIRGFQVLHGAVGPGAVSPSYVVVDAGRPGRALAPDTRAALRRLAGALRADPEVALVRAAPVPPFFIDPTGRYRQIAIAGRHEYGQAQSQAFARRLRRSIVPAARFPRGERVLVGGGPAQGIDFLDRSYGAFPWLVAAVLVLTYLLLMRAFRSLLLPLKAVLLNLLSVASSYGMLVVVFRWGVGRDVLGLYRYPQVEGWIPIFLFAMLFGLSMDYEVFLVTRMREAWDELHDNGRAVAHGLERTGRIITAAAVVMVAAFSGFVAGSILGLQEFGVGLAVAILVDATLVRAVLVPSLMAVFGRWNWWLPPSVARIVRVPPSPLERRRAPALRPAAK